MRSLHLWEVLDTKIKMEMVFGKSYTNESCVNERFYCIQPQVGLKRKNYLEFPNNNLKTGSLYKTFKGTLLKKKFL